MQNPDKPDVKPEPAKPVEGLKGLDLDKFSNATQELLKPLLKPDPIDEAAIKAGKALRKGADKASSFFKKAKAALKGDETAKEELADAAAKTVVKAGDALETAGKATGEMIDKIDRKITEAQTKKPQPPKP